MTVVNLAAAARELQEFCDSLNWRCCFIGGIAVQRWSEPRVTRDLDVTLLTGFGNEISFLEALLSHYRSRIADPIPFALKSRVVLLASSHGIGIDVSLGALPFEANAVQRATLWEYSPDLILRTCSAEDLMVMKLFASRAIDIRDAEGIAVRHDKTLDWNYVEEQLTPLADLKEDPEILRQFARIRNLPSTL